MDKYEVYFTFDQPVPYKSLKIHPVMMKDFIWFNMLVDCLTIDKNSIPNVKVIQMSYLEYLFESDSEENKNIAKLDALLKLVLKDDIVISYGMNENKKPMIKIGDDLFDGNDFENIKEIICLYNDVELVDDMIEKSIRDNIKEAERLRMKMSGNKMANLEDQIVAIMISTALRMEDIGNLSIRKFSKALARIDHKLHYQIYMNASMSGMVKFKDKSVLRHWLSDLSRDRLAENSISMEDFRNKMNHVSG